MNNLDSTYVIKINLSELHNYNVNGNININDIVQHLLPDLNISDNAEMTVMNKTEYNKYIFNLSGKIINIIDINTDNVNINCSICNEQLKQKNKIFKLNCNHIYHYKCINKWFKTFTEKFNQLHSCPLCKNTVERNI